jgi:hypothetical protein
MHVAVGIDETVATQVLEQVEEPWWAQRRACLPDMTLRMKIDADTPAF